MVIHQNFADFVLFLYVHMAHADGFFHPKERELILEKMTRLFPDESELDKKLDRVVADYLHRKSEDINLLIHDSFKQFRNVKFAQKYKIYSDLYDIVNADGQVDASETHVLDELKKIIDINAAESHH